MYDELNASAHSQTQIAMRRLHMYSLLLLLAAAMASSATLEQTTFPKLQGRNLEQRDMVVPDGLPGRAKLVIFGFVRDHQKDIDTWIPPCEELEGEVEGFRFFEVPFLAGRYRLVRSWIDGGMRRGIPDPEARKRTITVYGGRSEAMEQLGVTDLSGIYLFLVGPEGEILWRSQGRWSEEKQNSLRAALTTFHEGRPTSSI